MLAATSFPAAEVHGQIAPMCTKYPGNPVLVPGSQNAWDNTGASFEDVIRNGSSFVMFYTGLYNNATEEIGMATSTNGVTWTKYPTPIIVPGSKGSWDSSLASYPSVIWNGTEYLMYFTGGNSIGIAFSKDLVHWQQYANNPVLTPGPGLYDNYSISAHNVMYDPPLYKMWYSGRYSGNYTHSIGYATSSDGLHWTKYSGNPVMTRSTNNDTYVGGPWGASVVKLGSEYFAAYTNQAFVLSATSTDGIHWTSSPKPLLLNSNQTSGLDFVIETPSLLLVNSTLYVWYTAFPGSGSSPDVMAFAFCTLSPLVVTTTVTSTSVSTILSTTTQTSVSTTTFTAVSTQEVPSPASPAYEFATIGLAALLVVVVSASLVRRKTR